jgi:tripeptide aminopeptidase
MINEERLIRTFCDLVRIDSPSDEEEEMAQELSRRLSALGFMPERDAHGNLIASEDGDNPLLLSAHMDTVEPGRGIKPRVEGDRVVSDGTTILGGDCKAGVAAILEALESMKEDNTPRRSVQLAFTRGEEIGLVGARNMDFSMIKPTEAVVFDGNGPVNKLTSASPTYVSFEVKITGRSAHAGVEPEKGLSAIKIAAEIINQLPQGRLDEETTFNVGTISGGTVRNAVPESASFTGELRSRSIETLDLLQLQAKGIFDQVRDKYKEAVIEDGFNIEFHTYTLDPREKMLGVVNRTLESMGLTPRPEPSGGGTDGNVMRLRGIECVVVGMSTYEMHTVREYVIIPDLVNTATFCQTLLSQIAL